MTSPRLAGRVCLVTGATGGIGRAIATALAEHGARLALSGRDVRALEALATATGGAPIAADLTQPGAGHDVAERALEAHGRVDVLVNVAGAGQYGPAAELEPNDLERLVALNVTAPIELTCAVLPGMLERGSGHIVTIGSVAGRLGRHHEAAYAATKAAVAVFSDSLGDELAGRGVSVSLITPGVVDTRFFERRGVPYDRAWPRPIPPEDVAERVLGVLARPRAEVTVPRFLSVPVRLRGALPGVYRALSRRFDRAEPRQ